MCMQCLTLRWSLSRAELDRFPRFIQRVNLKAALRRIWGCLSGFCNAEHLCPK